jgi:hypothetical protein
MLDPMLSAYGEILSGSNNTNICNNNHNFFCFFFLFKEMNITAESGNDSARKFGWSFYYSAYTSSVPREKCFKC